MKHRSPPAQHKPGGYPDAVLLPGEVHNGEALREEGAEVPGPVAGEACHDIDAEGG